MEVTLVMAKKKLLIILSLLTILIFSFFMLKIGFVAFILKLMNFFADILYVLCPFFVLALYILGIISVCSKDFVRFNKAYMVLFLLVTGSLFSFEFEKLFEKSSLFVLSDFIKLDILAFLMISVIAAIVYFYSKKDTRNYLFLIELFTLFLLYKVFSPLV